MYIYISHVEHFLKSCNKRNAPLSTVRLHFSRGHVFNSWEYSQENVTQNVFEESE